MSLKIISALLIIQVLFGLNYVIAKFVMMRIDPLVLSFLRTFLSTLVLFPFCFLFRRKSFPKTSRFYVTTFFISIFGVVLNIGLFSLGLSYSSAINSSIIISTIPLITLAILMMLGKEKISVSKILGFILAFLGVALVLNIFSFDFSHQYLKGDILNLINSISFSIYILLSKKYAQDYDQVWFTCFIFFFGSLFLAIPALPKISEIFVMEWNLKLLSGVFYCVVGATLITYFLNTWSIARTKASSVVLFIYLQPIIASIAGAIFLKEEITLTKTLGFGLILIGVFLNFILKKV